MANLRLSPLNPDKVRRLQQLPDTYLLTPDADGTTYGRLLHVSMMTPKAVHKGFKGKGLPEGWRHESRSLHHTPGDSWPKAKYWIKDGALWSRVDAAGPSILWFDTPVRGNHAIRIVSASMPCDTKHPITDKRTLAELGAMWDGTGSAVGDDWRLTLFGFNSRYAGYAGIEYVGGKNVILKGHSVSRQLEIEPMRNYEIFAGRYNHMDFVFVDGVTITENLLPQVIARPEQSYVAITTYGNAIMPCMARIQSVEVFEIPDSAVEKIELAPPEDRGGR